MGPETPIIRYKIKTNKRKNKLYQRQFLTKELNSLSFHKIMRLYWTVRSYSKTISKIRVIIIRHIFLLNRICY